jgi:amino acid permease
MSFRDEPPPAEEPAHAGESAAQPEEERYQQRDWGDAGESSGKESGTPGTAGADESSEAERRSRARADRARKSNMLPGRERRRFSLERLLVRLIATGGVIGIGVALGAILASSNVQGWIIGLVVAGVSVVLSAILWSSRQL